MAKKGIRPGLLIGLIILAFFLVSLSFRIFLPYTSVFVGDWVKFTSNDAYYHMRLVDNLVHNFPHLTQFDPYFIFPGGASTAGIHFFDWLLAVIIWIIGLGSPTQHTIDIVSAYFPTILAALLVIPVFFIAKALFNRWAGLLAALLVAILPGEFMGRSVLGFTDHHVAETLFSTMAALFLILAIRQAGAKPDGQSSMTFNHLIKFDRKVITVPLVFSLLAGLFLGIYLITWLGALLFVFIFTVYIIIQTIVNHIKQKSSDHLGIIGFVVFLVATVIFLPFSSDRNLSLAMVAALLVPPVITGISRLMASRGMKTYYYPLSLIVIAAIVIGILRAASPSTVSALWANFLSVFAPGGGSTASTTMEMQPFLSPTGSFTTAIAWGNFTTSFFLIKGIPIPGFGLISFVILLWLYIKHRGENENLLFFLIWTLIMSICTLVQRRFAYYLVVNMAVLSAYISWQIIWWAGFRKLEATPEEKSGKERLYLDTPKPGNYYEILGITRSSSNKEIRAAFRKLASEYHPDHNPASEAENEFKEINNAYETLSNNEKRNAYDKTLTVIVGRKKAKKKPQKVQDATKYYVYTGVAVIAVFFSVFYFNITQSKQIATGAPYAPSDGWEESLTWMRDNTPDPMSDPNAYYNLYDSSFKYPSTAYGVTAWWDYGYWISRTARRIPSANPSQDPGPIINVANLFLSENVTASNKIVEQLKSSYIIEDYSLITSKLWAVVDWAGKDQNKYFEIYYIINNGSYSPVQVMKPDFYRTLAVRLYSFDGKAVAEGKPMVVTYEYKTSGTTRFKAATKSQEFSSYKAAQDFISSQKTGNYDIVGINPFVSPVPLEAVTNYKLIYSSKYSQAASQNTTMPDIKIFEHVN